MMTLFFGGLLLAGFAFFVMIAALVAFVVKSAVALILLPFRLLFWGIGAVFALVGVVIAMAVGLAVILAPLIPLALFLGLIYGLYRLTRRPAVA
jgi:hypothetical protein